MTNAIIGRTSRSSRAATPSNTMATSIITKITSRTEATNKQRDQGHCCQKSKALLLCTKFQPRQRERRSAHTERGQQPARDARQMMKLANSASVDDRLGLSSAHEAAAEKAQNRHRHGAKSEAARSRGEVGVAKELEHACIDRQKVGDRHAEMRAAGERSIEEAEPDCAGDQR